MSEHGHKAVRKCLQEYADRGVFRGFNEGKEHSQGIDFTFVWQTEQPLSFRFSPRENKLTFRNLLTNVERKSELQFDLSELLRRLREGDLPKHRRIDKLRAEVRLSNRSGNVSLALTVRRRQYAYGVNKIINLVHEIFVLLQTRHPDYMHEVFGAPQE